MADDATIIKADTSRLVIPAMLLAGLAAGLAVPPWLAGELKLMTIGIAGPMLIAAIGFAIAALRGAPCVRLTDTELHVRTFLNTRQVSWHSLGAFHFTARGKDIIAPVIGPDVDAMSLRTGRLTIATRFLATNPALLARILNAHVAHARGDQGYRTDAALDSGSRGETRGRATSHRRTTLSRPASVALVFGFSWLALILGLIVAFGLLRTTHFASQASAMTCVVLVSVMLGTVLATRRWRPEGVTAAAGAVLYGASVFLIDVANAAIGAGTEILLLTALFVPVGLGLGMAHALYRPTPRLTAAG